MLILTTRGKLLLKALGYTLALLVGPLILAAIIWTVTGNAALGSCSFWGGLFLGILAVLTDDLKKREALLASHSHKRSAVLSSSSPLEQALHAFEVYQVCTYTIVDLTCGQFNLHVTRYTDVGLSTCIPSHDSTSLRITQDMRGTMQL